VSIDLEISIAIQYPKQIAKNSQNTLSAELKLQIIA